MEKILQIHEKLCFCVYKAPKLMFVRPIQMESILTVRNFFLRICFQFFF
jgi:hypothetical protein